MFAGIILFSFSTLFQLVTLPVEFNASHRALKTLENNGILVGSDLSGARNVLSAAAMTYVASMLVSALQLLRLILSVSRRR
jgi:Zn-dependent membrane protease YugP